MVGCQCGLSGVLKRQWHRAKPGATILNTVVWTAWPTNRPESGCRFNHDVPRRFIAFRSGLPSIDLIHGIVDDLAVGSGHRFQRTLGSRFLHLVDDAFGETAECCRALLAIAGHIDKNPVRAILRLTLHEGTGQVLHCREAVSY